METRLALATSPTRFGSTRPISASSSTTGSHSKNSQVLKRTWRCTGSMALPLVSVLSAGRSSGTSSSGIINHSSNYSRNLPNATVAFLFIGLYFFRFLKEKAFMRIIFYCLLFFNFCHGSDECIYPPESITYAGMTIEEFFYKDLH